MVRCQPAARWLLRLHNRCLVSEACKKSNISSAVQLSTELKHAVVTKRFTSTCKEHVYHGSLQFQLFLNLTHFSVEYNVTKCSCFSIMNCLMKNVKCSYLAVGLFCFATSRSAQKHPFLLKREIWSHFQKTYIKFIIELNLMNVLWWSVFHSP